ncbi:MAG: DNA polymerase Y family protein [Gammaproteobacteria bacterium]|nr:DNA polymerase Y family protein [Gammaproteobacteria bacterium]
MYWLAAHFPMLGFEVQRSDEDADRPVVLIHDNRVCQADERALQAGIALGSTLATAHSIAPKLVHFPYDTELQAKQLEVLAQATYRFSSEVSLTPPDALLIESSRSLRLFGGREALRRAVSQLYARLGHAHRLATAATPMAALILSRAGLGDHPGEAMVNVRAAPLAAMDLSEKELERLANMGMTKVGQLLDLPMGELGKRFNVELVDALDRLTGRRADPRETIAPAERFHSRLHLLEPIRGKDPLLFPMRRLADELSRWLKARCLGTRTLIWSYAPFADQAVTLDVRFAQPRTDAKSFLSLTQLQLDRAELPEEVMTVSLQAGQITPLTPASQDLLALADDRGNTSQSELVDRLAAKLGTGAIAGLGIADDHRPELAWRWQAPSERRRTEAPPESATEANRPLWLLDPPRPVNVKRFRLLDGPERIDVGWWEDDARALERDYFVAVAQSGTRCWLYRDRERRWYLHGYFS